MFPLVMGVVNVTPDSFSDGGCFADPRDAIAHARELVAAGCDVVDVGGESTRPGADPVPFDEELRRVIPVVEALAGHVRVSIDTMKPTVAAAAVAAGATLVNDVSGSLELARVAAHHGVGWVCMHMQGSPRTMQHRPEYVDVAAEVTAFLVERAEAARALGVPEVWVDPGIGFGKTMAHNLALLARLPELVGCGFPVLVGTSRKSFLGRLNAEADTVPGPASAAANDAVTLAPTALDDRLEGSIATAVWAFVHGAGMVRVHDVAETVAARRVFADATAAGVAA